MFRRQYTVISVKSYVDLCHISHPTSRCKQTTSKSSPSWRSAHRKAEALSSGWSRHSFLRPGGGYLVTSFRDVQNFVSKMWLHRPLSPWSLLLMQFGWPSKQIGDWGWKGRKGPLFSLVWFYQSGHVTSTVIPGHPNDLCQILLGNFSLQSTWRDDWDGRCVTVSPGTRMLHSKVEWRKPRLKKLMWPLPFGLSEISRSEWTCYL